MTDKEYPWWKPEMGDAEKSAVSSVIESGFPNDGPVTTRFENRIAEIAGTKYALAVTSCTAGLYLSLLAAGVGPGDEVIVPDITFIATANAVSMTGATPILVDVSKETFCLDPVQTAQHIGPKTKAIIPVHVSGRPADLDSLLAIAKKHNLVIVEDAAEALGSNLKGRPLGSFGMAAAFSFSPAKTITTGQGGVIVTNDSNIFARLVELKDQGRPTRGTGGDDLHVSIGFNFKYTDLQAAMGLAQLATFDQRVARLRRHYYVYKELLPDSERLWIPEMDIEGGACPQWIDIYCEDRDNLHAHLKERKMDCRKFWHPIHTQQAYAHMKLHLPNSVTVSRNAMWLPSALSLTDANIKEIAAELNKWAAQRTTAAVAI